MLFNGYSVEHSFQVAKDLTSDELGNENVHEIELFLHIKDESQE